VKLPPGRELVRLTREQSKSVVSLQRKAEFSRDFPAGSRAAPVPLPGGFELLTAVILSAIMVLGTRVDILRTHEHFDGITLAPDGKHLSLDYYDYPEPDAQRFFHYVLSLHSSPKLITGRSPISVDSELELAYEDIPPDVIHDLCSWLESNMAAAHAQQGHLIFQILTDYRGLLERHRPSLP
jgi:hypothetical protein